MKSFKFNKIELAGLFAAVLSLFSIGAVDGQTLFVSQNTNDTVASYNATTGAAIANPLATSVPRANPYGIGVSGNTLYLPGNSTVATYNATTGAVLNSNFITGLSTAASLAVYGNNLYVANYGNGHVQAYNATTGAALGGFTTFTANDGNPLAMAVSTDGSTLYVESNNTVGSYNATTGAAINSTLISGVNVFGLAVSGNNLFLAGGTFSGAVAEYNATTGALTTSTFITGLGGDAFLALSGNDLFTSTSANNTIGEYNATTGAAINSSFITGLSGPYADTVLSSAPEPSQTAMLVFGGFALLALRRRMRKTVHVSSDSPIFLTSNPT